MRGTSIPLVWVLLLGSSSAAQERRTENVILVTLDGVRAEEMFGGADLRVLKRVTRRGKVEDTEVYKKYWASTPEQRREKVMPFFWGTWMKEHGSIAGNRALGSTALLTNRHRFSYPGYSEILTGQAHDETIRSNDKKRNPYSTVLEFLKSQLQLEKSQVGAFASWDVMDWIVEREEGAITSNAGFESYDHPDPDVRRLSELQFETDTPWGGVRHDAYTFRFALAHLESYGPRVLHLGLGETDDWAHDGNYLRVLEALERTDLYLKRLWDFLQSHDRYRGKTSIVITTDHGRGSRPKDWTDHGAKVPAARFIWMAFISPDSRLRGEWSNHEPIYQNQVAATLCRFLGLDYGESHPGAGRPISQLFER